MNNFKYAHLKFWIRLIFGFFNKKSFLDVFQILDSAGSQICNIFIGMQIFNAIKKL